MGFLLITPIGIAIVAIIASMIHWGYASDPSNKVAPWTVDVGVPSLVMLVVTIVPLLAISLSIALTSAGSVNDKIAFYDNNAEIYTEAVKAVKEGVQRSDNGILFIEGANLKQISHYSETVNRLRAEVVEYNRGVQRHRFWQDSFWFGSIWKDLPDRLQPLEVDFPTIK